MAAAVVACVDIGTYSTRLLIAEIHPAPPGTARRAPTELKITLDEGRTTNLGRGLAATGRLSTEAVEESAAAVRHFLNAAKEAGASAVKILATEAVRQAANGDELLSRLPADTEVLSPEREAFFAYTANAAAFPDVSPRIVMDEGGGSTEIAWGDGPEPAGWKSFRFGVVSLTEQFLKHDSPAAEELAALRHELSAQYRALPLEEIAGFQFIALGGTITSLAALHQGQVRYNSERVHGFRLPIGAIYQWYEKTSKQTLAERAAYTVVGEKRAKVMVAGLAEFMALFSALRPMAPVRSPADTVLVSEWGIRHGALLSL